MWPFKKKYPLLAPIERMVRNYLDKNVPDWQAAGVLNVSYQQRVGHVSIKICTINKGRLIGKKGVVVKALAKFISEGLNTAAKVSVVSPKTWA